MSRVNSMTGFGKGEGTNDQIKFNVEIKTINNRYNDINIKIPKYIRGFEENIRKRVKQVINRGKVDIYVSYEILSGNEANVKLNSAMVKGYLSAINELMKLMETTDKPKIDSILGLPEILEVEKSQGENEENWQTIGQALEQALEALSEMRSQEGNALKDDILANADEIDKIIESIKEFGEEVVTEYRDKLRKRVVDLMDGQYSLDENRLYNEVVFFADRSDIHEELVRLSSHIAQLRQTIDNGGVIGRKLDFILQEVNREANTIASKTNDIHTTQKSVEIKNFIEKIREQVQNIE